MVWNAPAAIECECGEVTLQVVLQVVEKEVEEEVEKAIYDVRDE